jgi:putative ABC transport system ATP-binding protein
MNLLALDKVSKTRGRGRRAVKVLYDVTVSVEAGEFVWLEGPSGAGKTTLLAVGGGILTPDSGRVYLGGHRLQSSSRAAERLLRARTVGFVFQRSNLLPQLTVRENIFLMGRLAGRTSESISAETDELLERLGLRGLRDRFPQELSCGEEQRVAVARALVHRPPLVLADEPTSSLDSRLGLAVAESLAELARQRGAAVVVATHDARIATFASRRIGIRDGRITD